MSNTPSFARPSLFPVLIIDHDINPAHRTNKWDCQIHHLLHSRPHHLQLDQAIRKGRLNGVKGIEEIITSTLQEALELYMIKSYTLAAPEEAPPSSALGTLTDSTPHLPKPSGARNSRPDWRSEELSQVSPSLCQSPAIKMPEAYQSQSPVTGGGR